MEFNIKTSPVEKLKAGLIAVALFENKKYSPYLKELDSLSNGAITSILKKGEIEGKVGQTLLLHTIPDLPTERVLIVGCGVENTITDNQFREIIRRTITAITQTGAQDALIALTEIPLGERDHAWKIRQIVELTEDALYRFDEYKSSKDLPKQVLRRFTFPLPSKRDTRAAETAILEGLSIAHGVEFTKNLGNTPPNICTPSFLATAAKKLGKQYSSLSVAVLDEKDLKSLKMGALLSVSQGSKNPPHLITIEYRGRKDKQKPIVLVGKGVTFDTGGNSLKPAMSMIGMKYDMCGGAAVLGTLRALAEAELPINVVGVIPTVENMPGNSATRPEDIVTSMSGLTVEILNTDAEGRLILCDALTYCERFNPEYVIDIATLTGACAVALGRFPAAVLSNDQKLADDLLKAGTFSGDRCWQLPLWDDYQEALTSNFADIANIGTPSDGGTILGAAFLSRFTKNYRWAHLDVANVAARFVGKDRGATGRPVALLMQYLIDRCK